MSAPHLSNPLIPAPEGDEDPTQLSLMIQGKPYLALDSYLDRLRNTGAIKLDKIVSEPDGEKRMDLWRKHAVIGPNCMIVQRFFCEYGFNLTLAGENFIGANCTFVDVCPIYIGARTMIGPDVKIYTPDHPISPEARAGLNGEEWGKPVMVEEDCWICGSVVILPGVTIGRGSTIAAGSVVTRSVPPRSLVMGTPGRVVKTILPDGSLVKV